jgi:phosphate-selective porin OprO/OprP
VNIERKIAVALIGFAVLLGTLTAPAQEWTEREKKLLEIIHALEKRVSDLEVAGDKANDDVPSPQPLEERVSELEKTVEASPPAPADNDMRVYWRDGVRFETNDSRMQLRIGGRIQNDWGFFTEDSDLRAVDGAIEDGAEFRRARLYVSGTLYDRFIFKAQYDFADGDADFKDMYIGIKGIPHVGRVVVGHVKEPFGLEESTSSKYGTFLERSLSSTFAPGRNVGILLTNQAFDGRMSWGAGIFRDGDDYGEGMDDGGYSVTARVTGLPWYAQDGRRLVHLGASYSHRNPDSFRIRSRPEAHMVPTRFVDTKSFAADSAQLVGAEAALVVGPFSAQGEFNYASVDSASGSDVDFRGYYAQASYFLTGEHRPYSKSSGSFSRIQPKRDFGWGENRGPGAWQLALRYSNVDFDDSPILGGEEENITAALNWYLNRYVRVMFNYVHADIDHVTYDGDIDMFLTRFQIDF